MSNTNQEKVNENTIDEEKIITEEITEEKINNRQIDIVENYELPEGDKVPDQTIAEKYPLDGNATALAVIGKLKEFKAATDARPFESIDYKFKIKYSLAMMMDDLLNNPVALKLALIHATIKENDLVIYSLAMSQLDHQSGKERWKYDHEALIKLATFLNLITLYHYELTGAVSGGNKLPKDIFEKELFKSGVSKSSAATVAGMLY